MRIIKTRKKWPLVYVEFIDHATADEWLMHDKVSLDHVHETMKAVGWLISENKTILCLAPWVSPLMTSQRSFIVKAAITKRKIIRGYDG